METSDPAGVAAPSLEEALKDEVLRMYQEVAEHPDKDYHFYHGRQAAEMFGYEPEALDRVPAGALDSFAGVGNPQCRSRVTRGEDVLDVGSGAGLDSLIAAWQAGPNGSVTGIDMNATMLAKAKAHAAEAGLTNVTFRQGTMEQMPIEDASIDVAISNGVINLSFRKRRVFEELFRVMRPGGRVSITDIVSARPLAQSIVNDPKLWASWIGGALPEGEVFRLLEESGFSRVHSAVVQGFAFRNEKTQEAGEGYGVKAVIFTAVKPAE